MQKPICRGFSLHNDCACILTLDGTARTEDDVPVRLEDVSIFFSGADREPPLGFHPEPSIVFVDENCATASTCALRMCLPIKHSSYEDFKDKLILSLKGHDGLGRT